MKFLNEIESLLNNFGADKLYLSIAPAFCALICSADIFRYDFKNGFLFLISIILLQFSIKIFDDFIDWIYENPTKRIELEQSGVRLLSTKCNYFLFDRKSPRLYFYIAAFLFLTGITIISFINIWLGILITILLITLGFINYHPKFSNLISKIGTETLITTLCAPLCILFTFLISAKCITLQILYISLIVLPFTMLNVILPSFLNLRADILTDKTTIPVIIKNNKLTVYLFLLLSITPYILILTGVYLKILPKLSLITLILFIHSLWLFYLIYIFEKEPQKVIKWNIFIGEDKNKIYNEQNNISWFTVRVNFARNIYITFLFLLTISLIKWSNTFIFNI